MRAEPAEADVRVGVAEDVEPLRVVEDVLVEVRRPVEQADPLPLLDPLPAELGVGERGALEHRDRRAPPDDLVGRRLRPLAP